MEDQTWVKSKWHELTDERKTNPSVVGRTERKRISAIDLKGGRGGLIMVSGVEGKG